MEIFFWILLNSSRPMSVYGDRCFLLKPAASFRKPNAHNFKKLQEQLMNKISSLSLILSLYMCASFTVYGSVDQLNEEKDKRTPSIDNTMSMEKKTQKCIHSSEEVIQLHTNNNQNSLYSGHEEHTPSTYDKEKNFLRARSFEDLTVDLLYIVFSGLPFKPQQATRCVSRGLYAALSHTDFNNHWLVRFLPSTPKMMEMSPSQFIHYWSIPSFEIVDESIPLVRHAWDESAILKSELDREKQHMRVQLKNGETKILPCLKDCVVGAANTISTDGSILAGFCVNNQSKTRAVQWTNGEIRELRGSNNDEFVGFAFGMSADGSTIVGSSLASKVAVQWRNDKIQELPGLYSEGYESAASSISADGSIIVGDITNRITKKSTALMWMKEGVFSIQSLLEGAGLNLHGIHLARAFKVSQNGLGVTGAIEGSEIRMFKVILPFNR
jgi:hypothetical protein